MLNPPILDLTPDPSIFQVLEANANATITYQHTRNWELDPDTGNYTPGDVVDVSIRATVKHTSRPVGELFPGLDEKNILLKGFTIDPQTTPEGFINLLTADIEFDDSTFTGTKRGGRCRIHLPPENPFVNGSMGVFFFAELLEE